MSTIGRRFHILPISHEPIDRRRGGRPSPRRERDPRFAGGGEIPQRNIDRTHSPRVNIPGGGQRRRSGKKYRRCDCDLRQVQQERQQLQESIIKIQIHIRQGKRKVPYRPSGGGHTPGQQVRRGVGGCNSVWGEWRAACGVGGAWIWARQSRARNSSTFLSLSYSEQLSYLQPGYGIVMYVHAPDRPPGGMRVV